DDQSRPELIPRGSLLAEWQAATTSEQRSELAQRLSGQLHESQLQQTPLAKEDPNTQLLRQLNGLVLTGALPAGDATENAVDRDKDWLVTAPSVRSVEIPAVLLENAELVTSAKINSGMDAKAGSVQVDVIVGTATPDLESLRADLPVLIADSPTVQERWQAAFAQMRDLFPLALCYTKIVPVDEVVTLTLFHREDDSLQRLMLDDVERADLDRLWRDLHFVSQDAFAQVDAFAQLMEYATQDSDPRLFEPYREPIKQLAAELRQDLVTAESVQLDWVIEFAEGAYRHPLTQRQVVELRDLYTRLRAEELPHAAAIRLLVARILASPVFLYRLEKTPDLDHAAAVDDWELANRLSYFLWSSVSDNKLAQSAQQQQLSSSINSLETQASRMLQDPKVERLAREFACQWLHIYDFESLDEKSEQHFPEFGELRSDMHAEAVHFFQDLFQHDRSILSILDADHAYLNEKLSQHYAIPNVTGNEWRRVEQVRQYNRGGILGMASILAKQSGASRTSPILRGNWVAEVLLGDKLPKPPKDVPRLPEDETDTAGLTVRQLVEKHSSDARCAHCHERIDAFGFALESFDAIGRHRERDLANREILTQVKLKDGTSFDGTDGLRDYLLNQKRDVVVRQFCRKLLGYALGRGLQLSDEPLLDTMQANLAANDFRFSVAVRTIVSSRQFREIRGQRQLTVE
ncbi:MAG: DUF1592 domain-containing protein, partial [Planctomycetales bacterium]|nr:DUF1592 domain-containing protein [Planctomycetales bacterium]